MLEPVSQKAMVVALLNPLILNSAVCTSHLNAIRLAQFEMFKVKNVQEQPATEQSTQPIVRRLVLIVLMPVLIAGRII